MRMVVSNPGPVPVTIDRKGRQLGGGDFDVVDDSDRVTSDALAAGNIGAVERPSDLDGEHVQPGALEAFGRLDDLEAADAEARATAKAAAEQKAAEEKAAADAAAQKTTSRRHGGASQRSEA